MITYEVGGGRFVKAAVLLLLVLLPIFALADSFDQQVASIILLQDKRVQADLGITEEQRARMNRFADSHRAKLEAYYRELSKHGQKTGELSVDQNKLVGYFSVLKKGVLEQLSTAQIKRLREISLQYLGFSALADITVADRVGLSSAQHRKVAALVKQGVERAAKVQNKAIAASTSDLRSIKPKNEAEAKRIYDEANRRAEDATHRVAPEVEQIGLQTKGKVMAVLTPAQRVKWEALLGRPFNP